MKSVTRENKEKTSIKGHGKKKGSTLFKDCVFLVDVSSTDDEDYEGIESITLKLEEEGAKIVRKWSEQVTHLVFFKGKKQNYKKASENTHVKIINLTWINDCIKNNRIVSIKSKHKPVVEDEELVGKTNKRKKEQEEEGKQKKVKDNKEEELQPKDLISILMNDWKCTDENIARDIKRSLTSKNISLDCNNYLSKKRQKIVERIKKILECFKQDENVSDLTLEFEKIGLKIDKEKIEEMFLSENFQYYSKEKQDFYMNDVIKLNILHAIAPWDKEPLCKFTTIFKSCYGCNYTTISRFTYDGGPFCNIIYPKYQPYEFTWQQYDSYECIKIIREDSSNDESYSHHTLHKHFISLINQMQLCLSLTMRQLLIRFPIEKWHNEYSIIGITSELSKCNVYILTCKPDIDESDGETELFFNLQFIGTFNHSNINETIELISILISNLCFPKSEIIIDYITTYNENKQETNRKPPPYKYYPHFPDFFVINGNSYDLKYHHVNNIFGRRTTNKVRYCTINDNIECVIKRGDERKLITRGCLTLVLDSNNSFSISLKGECLADLLNDKEKALKINVEDLFLDILVMISIFEFINITHNDIKPENIVKYDNHWFLIDFESCTRFQRFDKEINCYISDSGGLLISNYYSKGYRSPERKQEFNFDGINYTGRVSPQSDLYSLGVVILEVLNKKRFSDYKNINYYLKYIETNSQLIKKYLPLMLKEDYNNRPTPNIIVKDICKLEKERITTIQKYYRNSSLLIDSLFPNNNSRIFF